MRVPLWIGRLANRLLPGGNVVLGLSIAQCLDRAETLTSEGQPAAALSVYRRVAVLDVDCADEEINYARRQLEEAGEDGYPSWETEAANHLASLPERDRCILLSRRLQRTISGEHEPERKEEMRREMLAHLTRAHELKPLRGKLLRTMEAMGREDYP